MLSVKVKTKISTIANAGEFSKEELLFESHDLINSDAVDKGTRNDDETRQIVHDKTITNFISSIPDVVERSTEYITPRRERETRDWRNMCQLGGLPESSCSASISSSSYKLGCVYAQV